MTGLVRILSEKGIITPHQYADDTQVYVHDPAAVASSLVDKIVYASSVSCLDVPTPQTVFG